MKFHFSSKNLTKKRGKDICKITPNETPSRWEVIEDQPKSSFNCELESRQCEYVIGSGQSRHRCKLRTRRALPYCWQHAQIVNHVMIRESVVAGAGMGLFACHRDRRAGEVVFRAGDKIALYARKASSGKRAIGEFMSNDELTDRYGECITAPYGVDTMNRNVAVDTACERSIASYANSSRSATTANAAIKWINRNTELWLFAKKPIVNGEEILWYYGDAYEFDYPAFFEHKVRHTRRKKTSAKCRTRKKSKRSRRKSRSHRRRSR